MLCSAAASSACCTAAAGRVGDVDDAAMTVSALAGQVKPFALGRERARRVRSAWRSRAERASTTCSTTSRSLRPAPATIVSLMCASKLSPSSRRRRCRPAPSRSLLRQARPWRSPQPCDPLQDSAPPSARPRQNQPPTHRRFPIRSLGFDCCQGLKGRDGATADQVGNRDLYLIRTKRLARLNSHAHELGR